MPVVHHPTGLVTTEHEFSVPLDHTQPEGRKITVFAREVADPDGLDRPYLVFFQGGPGHESPRPLRNPTDPGWLDRALKDFRVLMLDQRGTGRSSPFSPNMQGAAQELADYLKFFRADSIVRDAEWIRRELGVERWSVLGQSFGGFCVTTYLSIAPRALREAFITGGVPPVGRAVDDIYGATFERTLERNRRYFTRYPEDRERAREILARLEVEDVGLPYGDRLTPRRFRQSGNVLGMSNGGDKLHYLVELPFGSPAFLHDVETALPFSRNPIYAIIHEACYADGGATRWSAERMLPAEYEESPFFTGEHVFSWMFDDFSALVPLKEAAELLAHHEWPRLYDENQLRNNEVPAAAAIYLEDMYVESRFSQETVEMTPNLVGWVTNEYHHDALRVAGDKVLDRLIALARGRA
ncbi:MAG: alpha/beta hydrolase [Actinomycetota bacterium]|nr:alpha/beta hydrolase [Actinomycetota bacterium]